MSIIPHKTKVAAKTRERLHNDSIGEILSLMFLDGQKSQPSVG